MHTYASLSEKDPYWKAALVSSLAALLHNQEAGVGTQHPQDMSAASRTQSSQQAECRPGLWPNWRRTRESRHWKTSLPRNLPRGLECYDEKPMRNQLFLVSGKVPQLKLMSSGKGDGVIVPVCELACIFFWGTCRSFRKEARAGLFAGTREAEGPSANSLRFRGLPRSDLIEILCWLCSQATAPRSCAMKDERMAQRKKEGRRHALLFTPAKISLPIINIG